MSSIGGRAPSLGGGDMGVILSAKLVVSSGSRAALRLFRMTSQTMATMTAPMTTTPPTAPPTIGPIGTDDFEVLDGPEDCGGGRLEEVGDPGVCDSGEVPADTSGKPGNNDR